MPANVVKSPADERKWKRAKKIVRKEYGGVESKDKWPVVQHVFQNMKKHASADEIFWAAVTDELEKSAGLGETAKELIPRLISMARKGKATGAHMRILKNLSNVQKAGGDVNRHVQRFTLGIK